MSCLCLPRKIGADSAARKDSAPDTGPSKKPWAVPKDSRRMERFRASWTSYSIWAWMVTLVLVACQRPRTHPPSPLAHRVDRRGCRCDIRVNCGARLRAKSPMCREDYRQTNRNNCQVRKEGDVAAVIQSRQEPGIETTT